jgi:hypothetical protein
MTNSPPIGRVFLFYCGVSKHAHLVKQAIGGHRWHTVGVSDFLLISGMIFVIIIRLINRNFDCYNLAFLAGAFIVMVNRFDYTRRTYEQGVRGN